MASKKDFHNLQGKWTAVRAEQDGREASDIVGHVLVFEGHKFSIKEKGVTIYAGTLAVDLSASPARSNSSTPTICPKARPGGEFTRWTEIPSRFVTMLPTCKESAHELRYSPKVGPSHGGFQTRIRSDATRRRLRFMIS